MVRTGWIYGAVICLFLAGCGVKSNVIIPYHADRNIMINYVISAKELVDVPDEVLEIMRGQIKENLSDRNCLATKDSDKVYKADILIIEYRMRPDAARFWVGMMAGCDIINSKVTVVDSGIGKTVGESVFESSHCAAYGDSARVIEAHTKKIVDYLSGK